MIIGSIPDVFLGFSVIRTHHSSVCANCAGKDLTVIVIISLFWKGCRDEGIDADVSLCCLRPSRAQVSVRTWSEAYPGCPQEARTCAHVLAQINSTGRAESRWVVYVQCSYCLRRLNEYLAAAICCYATLTLRLLSNSIQPIQMTIQWVSDPARPCQKPAGRRAISQTERKTLSFAIGYGK